MHKQTAVKTERKKKNDSDKFYIQSEIHMGSMRKEEDIRMRVVLFLVVIRVPEILTLSSEPFFLIK